MIAGVCILLYLIIAFCVYEYKIKNSSHAKWENIMISISWICIIPIWILKKIQDAFKD